MRVPEYIFKLYVLLSGPWGESWALKVPRDLTPQGFAP